MQDPSEIALSALRFWRDRWNDLLIVALLVEFVIEAKWPEHSLWSSWNRDNAMRLARGKFWRKTITRQRVMVFAAFVVFAGVLGERIWGKWADDKSDEIRQNQQAQILASYSLANQSNNQAIDALRIADDATDRAIRLLRIEGNRQFIDDGSDEFRNLAKYKGPPVWIETAVWYALGSFEAWEEPDSFASSFIRLRLAGWKDPIVLGQHDPRRVDIRAGPDTNGVHVYSNDAHVNSPFSYENWPLDKIPLDSPENRQWVAAEAITRYLRSIGAGPAIHWNLSGELLPEGFPSDGIFITIGSHDVSKAISDEEDKLEDVVREKRRIEVLRELRERMLRKSK